MITPITNAELMTLFSSFNYALVQTVHGTNFTGFSLFNEYEPASYKNNNMYALNEQYTDEPCEVLKVNELNVSLLAKFMNDTAYVLDSEAEYKPITAIHLENRNEVLHILVDYEKNIPGVGDTEE